MRKNRGFSLIELLIVVAIILIIAAIAIPNLLRARIAANESSAAASVRTISTAELTYQTSYPTFGYAAQLSNLGPASGDPGCTAGPVQGNACIIDMTLALSGATPKSGFKFTAVPSKSAGATTNDQYDASAVPATLNTTGVKEFCATEDNVVRFLTPSAGTGATHAGCLGLTPIGN